MDNLEQQPKHFLHYFVDEFVHFKGDFYFEIHASPQAFAQKLIGVCSEKTVAWWQVTRQLEALLKEGTDAWDFELNVRQRGRRGQVFQTMTGKGVIYREGECSILKGNLTLFGLEGWRPILAWIGIPVFVFWIYQQISAQTLDFRFLILSVFVLMLMLIFYWIGLCLDRNYFYQLIQEAVNEVHKDALDKGNQSAVESSYEYNDKAQTS